MICTYCQNTIEDDSSFCIFCGASVAQAPAQAFAAYPGAEAAVCSGCGRANEAGSAYCVFCGKPINPQPQINQPQPKRETSQPPVSQRPSASVDGRAVQAVLIRDDGQEFTPLGDGGTTLVAEGDTFVNGRSMSVGDSVNLSSGDIVVVGGQRFHVRIDPLR